MMLDHVSLSLSLEGSGSCEILMEALIPDNYTDTAVECRDGDFEIKIEKLNSSSIYNISDDFLRCYEVSLEILSLLDVK